MRDNVRCWSYDDFGAVFIYSTAQFGNMLEGERRARFKAKYGCPETVFLSPRTGGNGATVRVVDRPGCVEGDALITRGPLALEILPADCPIVVLADPTTSAIAMIHGSRDALERGVVEETLGVWWRWAKRKSTRAAVSPHIKTCCHRFPMEVAAKVLRQWPKEFGHLTGQYGEGSLYAVDYACALEKKLRGLQKTFISSACTCCETEGEEHKFYSHRRSVLRETGKERGIALAWRPLWLG